MHHAQSSAARFGGVPADYVALHEWLDQTKEVLCDFRHRALRHHSQGIFEGERVFGRTIRNSDGREVPVRYILEQHVREDCGLIPTVADWFQEIPRRGWMSRGYTYSEAADRARLAADEESVRGP
jgi:hypothetical protein